MEKETFNKAQQILKRFDPLKFGIISVEVIWELLLST